MMFVRFFDGRKERICEAFAFPAPAPWIRAGVRDWIRSKYSLIALGPISITAARCVAWRYATPRNATRSRNGNGP